MGDLTHESDRILQDGKALIRDNRTGGRHRRSVSIGRGSADLKRQHLLRKLRLIGGSVAIIVIGAIVAGLVIDGIGFTGIMIALLAIIGAVALFSSFPRMKVPRRSDLNRGDVRQLVGRTELWLEAQRPALPPPAAGLIDQIGVQLDALGFQLEGVDQAHPSAVEIRKLVGEHLPEAIEAYRKIPAQLRREVRGGSTPDEQIADSLGKISKEIDSVTRQLASGPLDDLAIRTRYLDYKYGAEGIQDAQANPRAIEDRGA